MLSNKLLGILNWSTNICYNVGGSFLLYDKERKLFVYPNKSKQRQHVQINCILSGVWLVCSFIITIQVYLSGNTDEFNITLVYFIGGLTLAPTCALPILFPRNLCIAINGCLSYLRYFDG